MMIKSKAQLLLLEKLLERMQTLLHTVVEPFKWSTVRKPGASPKFNAS